VFRRASAGLTDVEFLGVERMQRLAQPRGRHRPPAAALFLRLQHGKQLRQRTHDRIRLPNRAGSFDRFWFSRM
jgi:hypothetical protein